MTQKSIVEAEDQLKFYDTIYFVEFSRLWRHMGLGIRFRAVTVIKAVKNGPIN